MCVYIEIYTGLQLVKEEVTSLKGKKEKYMGGFEGRKEKRVLFDSVTISKPKSNYKAKRDMF